MRGGRSAGEHIFRQNHKIFKKIVIFETKAALRVPLAVTWLTVYRQLHIGAPPRPGCRDEFAAYVLGAFKVTVTLLVTVA